MIKNSVLRNDIFVFSAREDEGFGIAMVEAMTAGIPILASMQEHV